MKKIINGKVYDTDTACALGYDSGDGPYWQECLYQKRTGEYFLYSDGGPSLRYTVTTRHDRHSVRERIIPLTIEAARSWAEEHLDAYDYMTIFGVPNADDPERVTLCIQIPAALNAVIRANAAERGQSLTAYITDILSSATR